MKNPQQSLKDWSAISQVGQFDYELVYGQCQTFLQSNANYDLHCAKRKIQPHFQQTIYALNLLSFDFANDVSQPQVKYFVLPKPNVNYQLMNLNDFHQCGQLELTHQGLAEKQVPLNDEHTFDYFSQEKHASNLLYEPKASVWKLSHTLYDVSSFCLVYLTNLIVHFQGCLLSSVRQYLVFQSKVHSFRSPVGGL